MGDGLPAARLLRPRRAARRRRSCSRAIRGDADKPRILTTFNEPISDWLSLFCFTYFTDPRRQSTS